METNPNGFSQEHSTNWKQPSDSLPKHEIEYDYLTMLAHLYNTEDLTAPPHSTYEDESTKQDIKKKD